MRNKYDECWVISYNGKLKKNYHDLLKYLASDMTYRRIAKAKNVNMGQITGMVDQLMTNVKVRNRTALVVWALKKGHLKLEDL